MAFIGDEGVGEMEIRTTSSTGGQKGVKPARYSLIPVPALDIMARLYGFGAEKYDVHNWRKGYEWSKSFDSLFRHATAALNGEDIDEETGLPHLAGAAFHCFTLMVFMQEHPEFDDRFKPASEMRPKAPMPTGVDSEGEIINTWGFDLNHNQVAFRIFTDKGTPGHFTPAPIPEPATTPKPRRVKHLQAKHISTTGILSEIDMARQLDCLAGLGIILEAHPDVPAKLVTYKVNRLIQKGYLGKWHNDLDDLFLTGKGMGYLAYELKRRVEKVSSRATEPLIESNLQAFKDEINGVNGTVTRSE